MAKIKEVKYPVPPCIMFTQKFIKYKSGFVEYELRICGRVLFRCNGRSFKAVTELRDKFLEDNKA